MKLSNSCSNWLYNMVLGGSSWSLDIEKRIGVASVEEEGAGEDSLGSWEVRIWKGACEKLDFLGSEWRNSS